MTEQQHCGKCGAVNSPDAITCVNCGIVLAAYASASAPASDPPATPTAESVQVESNPEPASELAPAAQPEKPSAKSSDWRDLFAQAPGANEPAPSFDLLPVQPAISPPPESTIQGIDEITTAADIEPPEPDNQTVIESVATSVTQSTIVEPKSPGETVVQPAPIRPRARAYPVQPPNPPAYAARMARFDRVIGLRSPQSFVLLGIMILFFGCVISLLLSVVGASDSTVGLLFICAGPLGFIVLVIGIILAVARREGRHR